MRRPTEWRRQTGTSSRGRPYTYWERVLPRIPDGLFGCLVFLYPSEDAATEGRKAGGTAFMVSRPNPLGRRFHYLVTNTHLAYGGCNWARVNTRDGGVDVVHYPAAAWVPHELGDDVSATPIDIDPEWEAVPLVWEDLYGGREPFEERMAEINLGVGDDVLMLGRFVAHDGRERNFPLVRFGNLAMMPNETIEDGRGIHVEAFLAEMHSLPGFSGSPVFCHIGPASDRADGRMMPFFTLTIALIGIDTGHTTQTSKVIDRRTGDPVDDNWRVPQNSGVAIVSPVWKIEELLDQEEFVTKRKEQDDADGGSGATSDIAEDESEFDRFTDLTRSVLHVTKDELDAKRKEADEA